MECSCKVLFEDPFWVALFEVLDEAGYRAARHVFGALPNEAELVLFAKTHYYQLSFSQPVLDKEALEKEAHFKRRQREARRFVADSRHPKKAWAALQLDLELQKQERKQQSREEKETAEQEAFLARQQQKKEKHRGH
jgi:hypothetical protein